MPPGLKRPDGAAVSKALSAIRIGANDEDAALYAGITTAQWEAYLAGSDEVRKARAELAVLAAGVVRGAAGADAVVAQRIVDRAAARHELERLRHLSGVST